MAVTANTWSASDYISNSSLPTTTWDSAFSVFGWCGNGSATGGTRGFISTLSSGNNGWRFDRCGANDSTKMGFALLSVNDYTFTHASPTSNTLVGFTKNGTAVVGYSGTSTSSITVGTLLSPSNGIVLGTGWRNGAGIVPLADQSRLWEWAIWAAALGAAEVAMLAAGVAPPLVRPDALVAYWPLRRNTELLDPWGGYTLSASGTISATAHGRVLYARRRATRRWGVAAAGAIFSPALARQSAALADKHHPYVVVPQRAQYGG